MTVKELKKALGERDLCTGGRKTEQQRRLREAVEVEDEKAKGCDQGQSSSGNESDCDKGNDEDKGEEANDEEVRMACFWHICVQCSRWAGGSAARLILARHSRRLAGRGRG